MHERAEQQPRELRVYLTGGVRIELGDVLVDHRMFNFARGQLALAYLVCERRRPVAAEELAKVFWDDNPQTDGPAGVHTIAEKIRRALSRHVPSRVLRLAGTNPYELEAPADLWVDIEAAADAIHEAEAELRAGRPAGAFGPSAIAHHITRRPFLPGESGHWVESQRERLRSILIRALECRGEIFLWNREVSLAIEAAKEVIALEPFRETAYQLLIRAHAALGNAAEATRAFERCRSTLSAQLGVEPSARTVAVYRDALNPPRSADENGPADGLPSAGRGSGLLETLQRVFRDSYRVERELGGGGMSRVFVATDLSLDRRVVIKVLPPDQAHHLSAERFTREVRLAARLQQANIVPILAAGVVSGTPYYTMPFVSGESLRATLSAGPRLSIQRAIEILRDVARALAFAHEHGVVHRDIKPENVLLSGATAVVTDFGIAKALSDAETRVSETDSTLTATGIALGTPHYMAPEQIAGDPAIDYRADIYSFGAMAFELLAGRSPFGALSAQAAITAHLVERPCDITAVRPDTPGPLGTLIMRCLEKQPALRPQSMSEVLVELAG
ncbi:MAG TPA: protein kinase [Vicinamibacterales bacterium]|nr:protein kinase [Vicinamibacterales bacterium]